MSRGREPEFDAGPLRKRHYNAVVTAVYDPAPGLRRLQLRPDDGLRPFEPGQHIKLGIGAWEIPADGSPPASVPPGRESDLVMGDLSFSHPVLGPGGVDLVLPEAVDVHEFFISSEPRAAADGEMRLTPRLLHVKAGDRLLVGEAARGRCTLAPVRDGEDVLFISTGAGVAPHNAMIWSLLGARHSGRIACIVSTRRAIEQAYAPVHRALAARYPSFTFVPLVTREPDPDRPSMHIQDLFEDDRLERELGWRPEPAATRIYLCGNPGMIAGANAAREGMIAILGRRGYVCGPDDGRSVNVHFERN